MKILQKICFVLLLGTFSSVYGGTCWDDIPGNDFDVNECRIKAEQGHSKAQYNLGLSYKKGLDVSQDFKETIKWYRLSAEQGYDLSQDALGVLYYDGQGVVQDYKEAIRWWKKSAEQGLAESQFNLGVVYYKGQGVDQDYVMSHMYFNLSSSNGDKDRIKSKDGVEKKMTSSQIEKAQDLAREWMLAHQ